MAMHDLPFKIDRQIESRSFVKGYRGAWFRCKIKDISRRKDHLGYALEFIDFPGEKVRWTQLYQNRSACGHQSKRKKTQMMVQEKQLMVRPPFPTIQSGKQDFDAEAISETIAIVNDDWKIGHLVDWLKDGCYWSGKVTKILSNGKVELELLPLPYGEGLSYVASCKNLRPSLNWSVESGWTVPTQDDDEKVSPCVRVVNPFGQGIFQDKTAHYADKERNSIHDRTGKSRPSFSSNLSASSLKSSDCSSPGRIENQITNDTKSKDKAGWSDSVSSSHGRDVSPEFSGISTGADKDNKPSKKMKREVPLNSTHSDTLEASILDLEELVCRVKWTRGILEGATTSQNTAKLQWKFFEHRASSTPYQGFNQARRN